MKMVRNMSLMPSFAEDLSSMGALSNIANVWINDCDGKEVIVKSSMLGLIGTFSIFPEWCREVK